MLSTFLSKNELEELTGARQVASQRKWLAERGYQFDIRVDGSIVILRTHLENMLGGSQKIIKQRKTEPNVKGLKEMMEIHA